MGVPARYLNKVTKQLKSVGILRTIQGHGGGYALMKAPEQISLYDILSQTEQTMAINRCLENEEFCSRHATDICPVRKVYAKINSTIADSLKATTVQTLLGGMD